MIIFNEKEKNCLRTVIEWGEAREKHYHKYSHIISKKGKIKELNKEESLIIKQHEANTCKLERFLNELDEKSILLLLTVALIGSQPDGFPEMIYRERFEAAQRLVQSIGYKREHAIDTLKRPQVAENLLKGVQHLGNTFEY
ncbi:MULTISPECIES: hypothetical protein [unclassified Paenibacillus]|uniref:hypothetical protein n=1 Tax=unclassified Paenibacillus TaxID=185978 RepID=UPI002117F92D|nr:MULTISPECIES: hypothetical protein [unclassified Paenibacillus]